MARLRNSAGVVINVSDEKAVVLGSMWQSVEGETSTGPTGYDALTVDELKDEIRKRNDDRDDDDRLALTGTKAELVASLEADDA